MSQSNLQIAAKLTKKNAGKKRVPIGQVREILKDLVELDANYLIATKGEGKNGPIEFLMTRSTAVYNKKLKALQKIKK